jgi:hypothetical protein
VLALRAQIETQDFKDLRQSSQNRHPRYTCTSHQEYITQYALPVYITQANHAGAEALYAPLHPQVDNGTEIVSDETQHVPSSM